MTTATPEQNRNRIHRAIMTKIIKYEYNDEEKKELHYLMRQILEITIILTSPFSPASSAKSRQFHIEVL